MIGNVDSGFSNVAAADGLLSQPSNQQNANPSAQTRNTPVDNPPDNRVNGGEAIEAGQNRAGETEENRDAGGGIDVRA